MRNRSLFPLLLIFMLASCSEPSDTPSSETATDLAKATAAVLENDAVREDVHAAMQASTWVDHKLVLHDFLETDAGASLRAALVDGLDGEEAYRDLLDDLPSMDFYVPYEEHRSTWEHAENDLLVVATLDADATEAVAWRPNGEYVHLSSPEEILAAAKGALFVLHPAEPKASHEHEAHDGATIDDPSVPHHPARRHEEGTVPMAYSVPSEGTWVLAISTGDCDGIFNPSCEIYFTYEHDPRDFGDTVRGTTRTVSVPPNGTHSLPSPLKITSHFPWEILGTGQREPVRMDMYEADGGLKGGDDYYGHWLVRYQEIYYYGDDPDMGATIDLHPANYTCYIEDTGCERGW